MSFNCKKIFNKIKRKFFQKGRKNMIEKDAKKTPSLSDRPCKAVDKDSFSIKDRIVKRIHSFLCNDPILPLNIAITGEWGVGKTSAINWLIDDLKKDEHNLIISFEPLLEGKLEIADILELFYLKLYDQVEDKQTKDVIKKSLISLAILARFKFTGKAQVKLPNLGDVGATIEKDFGKDIDDILELWSKKDLKLFSDQAEEINKHLKNNNCIIYVVIDEIDRLTAENIINFLLFARTLELFDRVVCIIGMDYSRVIQKLISEGRLGLSDYDSAKSYIDKLFQCVFKIHINETEKLIFLQENIRRLDNDKCLLDLTEPKDFKYYEYIKEVASYLSTPRHLKKFLVSIKFNYPIMKYTTNKLSLFRFLSAIVIHPILFENFSKHTSRLIEKHISIQTTLKDDYGIDTYSQEDFDKNVILLASLGIKNNEIKKCKSALYFYNYVSFAASHGSRRRRRVVRGRRAIFF